MFSLKATFLLLLLWQAESRPSTAPAASRSHFHFVRGLTSPNSIGQACAVLDGDVFAHASSSLKDLRLYNGAVEIPYATTLSETAQQDSEEARVLNLGSRAGRIVFDLEMPHRTYTSLSLDLAANDFIATAIVSGSKGEEPGAQTSLGTFTLFDLGSQHLSRSTSIPLQESSFPYLHVELAMSSAPGTESDTGALREPSLVRAATVPPSREAQRIFTTVAQTAVLTQQERRSIAHFRVGVRVPIERISFAIAPAFKANFSRQVEVKAHADAAVKGEADDPDDLPDTQARDEAIAGTINRVHTTEAGHEISEEKLTIATALGSNMQRPAVVDVAIDNGDDAPLPISVVRLEMRQRKICFDAATAGPAPSLYYGDTELDAPVYDYAKLFRPSPNPAMLQLEPERLNLEYEARQDLRSFTERHPELLWIGLLAVVCTLAVTAFRSAKRLH